MAVLHAAASNLLITRVTSAASLWSSNCDAAPEALVVDGVVRARRCGVRKIRASCGVFRHQRHRLYAPPRSPALSVSTVADLPRRLRQRWRGGGRGDPCAVTITF